MGKLDSFVAGKSGYFREGAEDEFPWERTDKGVWYSLLSIENGQIARYGFTSSKSNKASLCNALHQIVGQEESLLLGIWMGQYSTHLFVLDIPKAISKLKAIA